jgi:hypothetical protein
MTFTLTQTTQTGATVTENFVSHTEAMNCFNRSISFKVELRFNGDLVLTK